VTTPIFDPLAFEIIPGTADIVKRNSDWLFLGLVESL
jgi:hypothetical protein